MSQRGLFDEPLTRSVIGAFYEVYNTLGYGFLEQIYSAALAGELYRRGHGVAREVNVPVLYKGLELGKQRLDMLVEGRLVVEVKSSHDLPAIASRQLYNYLKGTGLCVGLLLHFGPKPRFIRVFRRPDATVPATQRVVTHTSEMTDTRINGLLDFAPESSM